MKTNEAIGSTKAVVEQRSTAKSLCLSGRLMTSDMDRGVLMLRCAECPLDGDTRGSRHL